MAMLFWRYSFNLEVSPCRFSNSRFEINFLATPKGSPSANVRIPFKLEAKYEFLN